MSDWLDLALSQELRPVEAPEELWRRVQAARRPGATAHRTIRFGLPAFATVAVLLAVTVLWSGRRGAGLEAVAARELAGPASLQMHSNDAAEIGAWLRREAGVDVALPPGHAKLEGARVIREHGAVIGAVSYRVGNESALLLVARAGESFRAPAKHGGLTWQRQQQVYAVACSSPGPAACALCHTNL